MTTTETLNAERQRLEAQRARYRRTGACGGHISPSAPGERCARTTASTAPRGSISTTIRRARAPTAGTRTAWAASATRRSACALRLRCGTAATRSSRSARSGSPATRATTARTSRSTTSTWTPRRATAISRYLYKYPQAAYPYARLVEENARRSRNDPPFSLLDTGVFDESRYWDVEVRYAKASPEEIHIRIIASNRGPEAATLHVLPTLWFRNTWSWGDASGKPQLAEIAAPERRALGGAGRASDARHVSPLRPPSGGDAATPRTRATRSGYGAIPAASPYVKDAFHRYVVNGEKDAVNPEHRGTKFAALPCAHGRSRATRRRSG